MSHSERKEMIDREMPLMYPKNVNLCPTRPVATGRVGKAFAVCPLWFDHVIQIGDPSLSVRRHIIWNKSAIKTREALISDCC